jgi:hypothetical protein
LLYICAREISFFDPMGRLEQIKPLKQEPAVECKFFFPGMGSIKKDLHTTVFPKRLWTR